MSMFAAAAGTPLTAAGPRPLPIAFSALMHASILSLVAFGPPLGSPRHARTLYEEVIKPREHDLVWYSFRAKLPEVSPAENPGERPAGVEVQTAGQTLVSNPKQAARGTQMIWRPGPQIKPQPEIASPNILAFRMPLIAPPAPGPVRKLFVPPQPKLPKLPEAAPKLPEPPLMQAGADFRKNAAVMANLAAALEFRLKPRTFAAPAARVQPRAAIPTLPEAPAVATSLRSERAPMLAETMAAPLANKPQARKFVPPVVVARARAASVALPDAPGVALQWARTATAHNAAIPDPALALANKPKARAFVAPTQAPGGHGLSSTTAPPIVEEAPSLDAAGMPSSHVNVAVVGLNPATKLSGPLPESSRDARFSAGPNANGGAAGDASASGSMLSVPGLLVRNGAAPGSTPANPLLVARAAPTSRAALQAAFKDASMSAGGAADDPPSTEIRLVPPPDPQFIGRDVYTLAVQMPNITSYLGSWIMWFAERTPAGARAPGGLRPPVPLHKVDPKYYPAAIAERVEGKVQLAGVIGADGRVDRLRILKSVDPRLDRSAAEALEKWEFQPAERNGAPVEVDVVAEIPFLLAPQAKP